MLRRAFLAAALSAFAWAGPVLAASYSDLVVQQLADQGFRNIRVTVTLLGRVRILADGDGGQREIILNPNTGEILRDLWTTSGGKTLPVVGGNGNASSGGTGNGGDDNGSGSGDGDEDEDNSGSGSDDDDDEDEDEDDDEDDDSGRGRGGDD